MKAHKITTDPATTWRNPWVIGWLVLIAVVLLVNLTLVTLALITSPGLVVDDYYERGQAMENTIRSRAAAAPGWLFSADIPPDLSAQRAATLRFFIVDQAGQPVSPDRVTCFAYRPADAGQDFSHPMVEEAPGRYRVDLRFPQPGIWDIVIGVRRGADEYHYDQRLKIAQAASRS